jgi:DNA processing protein
VSGDPDRLARAALCRVGQQGSEALLTSLVDVGAKCTLVRLAADRVDELLTQAEQDVAQLVALGGRLVCPGDDEWPERLEELAWAETLGPPPALWVRGEARLDELLLRSIAVVGSRSSTPHGQRVCAEIAGGLSLRDWTVVSGAARGIDACAHRATLSAGGPTVAVLANGVDIPYPAAHTGLLQHILDTGGLILSEVACGVRPGRHRFLARNRIIAAITRGTVLVEAGPRSGALNTVGHAHALSRQVCVVPGPIGPTSTAGCFAELRRGRSSMVTSAVEVLEDIAPVGAVLAEATLWPAGPRDRLSFEQAQLLDLLPAHEAVSGAELVTLSGLPVRRVAEHLGSLELAGLIARQRGKVILTPLGRTPSGVPMR